MATRGPYHNIPMASRDRVLKAAEDGLDWQAVAAANAISYHTAYGWLRSGGQPLRPRGGDKRSKLTTGQIDVIVSWLEENPQLSLRSIRNRIEYEMGVQVSPQTVSNRLDGRLITLKKVHYEPMGINSIDNKLKRRDYVARLMHLTAGNKTIIFMDETNFNLFCRRSSGRARRGERSVVVLPNSKGPNLNIIGAITSTGLIHWERQRGSFKMANCNDWLRRCLLSCIASGIQPHNIVVVIDNAPAHSQTEAVFLEAPFHGGQILRLAPYSAMLNAIEHVWSAVKAHIKNRMQVSFQELIAGDPAGILTQTEFRLRFLERCADEAMLPVNQEICSRVCNHVQKHYADALQLQDMPVGH
jgi:transposase